MNKKIIWVIILILIVLGLYWLYQGKSPSPAAPVSDNSSVGILPAPTTPAAVSGTTKDFTVIGTNFAFEPAIITVKKGDMVHIIFKDEDGFHDLRIDGYQVSTERISEGGTSEVTFLADKVGTFEYYCSVGNHRDQGMRGTLVVNG